MIGPSHHMGRSNGPSYFVLAVISLGVIGYGFGVSQAVLPSLFAAVSITVLLWLLWHQQTDSSDDRFAIHPLDMDEDGVSHASVEEGEGDGGGLPSSRELPPVEPAPFGQRLARFLHCDESELQPSQRRPISTMAFWVARPFRYRVGPKPVWYIRRLLKRIHQQVHGVALPQPGQRRWKLLWRSKRVR